MNEPARFEPYRGLALWGPEEENAALRVLRSRSLFRYDGPALGGHTGDFERKLAELLDMEHTVAVSSGTAALTTAIVGLGLPPGTEVLVPAVTFVGCVNAIVLARCVPVFVDVDDTLTMDPAAIDEVVGDRTGAVMPVHLANVAADMDPIRLSAQRHDLRIIEDAAQALGVSYRGRRVGAWGDVACYSFQQDKNITAGEGGAVATNNAAVHDRVMRFQDQGGQFATSRGDVRHEAATEAFCGANFRMTELAAAILRTQIERLDPMLTRLRDVAAHIRTELSDVVPRWRRIPDEAGSGGDVTMLLESRMAAKRAVTALTEAGVPALTLYQGQPVYANPAVRAGRTAWGVEWPRPRRCHGGERLLGSSVTIRLGAAMTDTDVEWLVSTSRDALKSNEKSDA